MPEGGLFQCIIFGVWSSSSPQRDGADGYSYLILSHFSVYFLEIVSYRMINWEGWGEKEEEGLEALLKLLLIIITVKLALGNTVPFLLQDNFDTTFEETNGGNKVHMTQP